MKVFRRTWLATTLFAVVSTAVWWRLIGWSVAWKQLPMIVLFAPPVWWFVVARRPRLGRARGVLAGALTGLLAQSVRDAQKIWDLYIHRGSGDGEAQAVAITAVVLYLLIALWATVMGAVLGLIAATAQRRIDGELLS